MRFPVPCLISFFSINLFNRNYYSPQESDSSVSSLHSCVHFLLLFFKMHWRKMIFINFSIICLTGVRVWICSQFMCRIGHAIACFGKCDTRTKHRASQTTRRKKKYTRIDLCKAHLRAGGENKTKITFTRWHTATKQKQPVSLQLIRSMNCNYYFILFLFSFFIYLSYRIDEILKCGQSIFRSEGQSAILPIDQLFQARINFRSLQFRAKCYWHFYSIPIDMINWIEPQ